MSREAVAALALLTSLVRNKMPLKKILLAGIALAIATSAPAADFTTISGCGEDHSDKSCTSIYINGKIEAEDGGKWKDLLETIKTPRAVVTLNSPGGSVTAGLFIAYNILAREYDTAFYEGVCWSMCANIWLAGKTRYMSSGVSLGFHSTKTEEPRHGTTIRSKYGNSLLFDYYAKLRLPEKTMKYLYSAGPNDLALVTVDKAIELGLRAEVWPKPKKSDAREKTNDSLWEI